MRRRCRTLVVPYLIACLFPALFALALETMPWTGSFVNGSGFSENLAKPWHELLWLLYVDSGSGQPYAFHLWFLRDLIVIVALSPLLLLLIRKIGIKLMVVVLFALNFAGLPDNPTYGLFWFVFGAWFVPAIKNLPPPVNNYKHFGVSYPLRVGNAFPPSTMGAGADTDNRLGRDGNVERV